MRRIIYADNAATTKLDIEAFEAMKPFLLGDYGNASQPYAFSRTAKKALSDAREIVASCINAEADEIFFTSGGTESDNWAIKGVAYAYPEKKRIVTTSIEHHAVLRTCNVLADQGFQVDYVAVDKQGIIDQLDLFDKLQKAPTSIVSIMTANNEIGTIQPFTAKTESIIHENGALFHTDAVQAVGHIEIDVKKTGVDLLSASAHKFNGPKGIGFLYIKKGTPITSYLTGGMQEKGMRAGTENVASIVGLAVALSNNCKRMKENQRHIQSLDERFMYGMNLSGLAFIRNGSDNHLPGIINLSFKGQDGEAILHRMDLMGISISTGSACDSVTSQVSHVLQAIRLDETYAKGTIRISLGKDNTEAEVDLLVEAIKKIMR